MSELPPTVLLFLVLWSFFLTVWPVQTSSPPPQQTLEFYRREARSARDRKDYGAMVASLQDAARLAPTHPRVLLGLADALALIGKPGEALDVLARLAKLDVFFDLDADPDLQALRSDRKYTALLQMMRDVRSRRIGESQVVARLPERDLLTEGVAYDARAGALFVSAVHRRKIVQIDPRTGRVRDFISFGRDGLWGAKGMRVDPKRRWLWVASMALPQAEGYAASTRGVTGLFAYDLDSGALRRHHVIGSPDDPHGFDDLTIDSEGRVFVSDALTGAIWWTSVDGTDPTVFLPAGTFLNPNGIDFGSDGRFLYVSDYPRDAILAVEVKTRKVQLVSRPPDLTVYSADGLISYGGSLVIIQNGVTPHRIVRLFLDDSGTSISRFGILEMNNPQWAEPTLGVVVGDDLYYVGVSQWGRFDEESGEPARDKLQEPAVFRLKLGR